MLYRCCLLLFLAALALPVTQAQAQATAATLSGTVTDSLTGAPLPGVNVFIATSMNGTVTDDQGRFRLRGIPLGALRLYVTMIGFEPKAQDIFVREAREYTFDFELKEAVYEVGEITVTADNKKWKQQLEKFILLFIGETPNAGATKIVNPEVLDFSAKGGEFRAQASEPLIIENEALGYRIQYFLREFSAIPNRTKYDGEPLFETMSAKSPEQAALWKAKRDSAFNGSFRHFMLALLNNRVEEQGFKTYSRPSKQSLGGNAAPTDQRYPIAPTDLLKDGDTPGEKILDFEGFVEIIYVGEEEDPAYLRWTNEQFRRPKARTSMIYLHNGPTVVDLKGDVLDPYGVTFYLYLAFERVADEVPKEYRPWLN